MLYTHNWWHVALFYMPEGDLQQALALYDQHVWGRARRHSAKDQVGAISLLLRLELKGADVQPYWQQLAPICCLVCMNTHYPFRTCITSTLSLVLLNDISQKRC